MRVVLRIIGWFGFLVVTGHVSGSSGETLSLTFDHWSSEAHAYWDRRQDGLVDISDMIYFREPYFEDVTGAVGIAASHHAIEDYFAIGQAWGDFDGDGWLDLYVTDSNGPNSLYRNRGDGAFDIVVGALGTALSGIMSAGAVFADFNNDGWADLYVLNDGANTLFRNDSGTGFTEIGLQAGVADTGRGQSGAWGDFDKDGYLDLYVTNWGEPGQFEDRFYRNNGDETFTDITVFLGPRTLGAGFVTSYLDFDNDGDLDLYLVNDKLLGNVLWRNDGPGCGAWCFSEISDAAGAGTQVFGMGLAIGDYDGDLDLDMYFSNIGPMVLLQNQASQGSPVFVETSDAAGVALDTVGWGAVFFDFDHDGHLDLYLATMLPDPLKVNRFYRNRGDGSFADISYKAGTANLAQSLGVAYADYDRDGYLDLAVGNMGLGYTLYRNRGVAAGNRKWLHLKLVGGGPSIGMRSVRGFI